MHVWQSARKRRFVRTYSPLRVRIPGYRRSRLLRLLVVAVILTLCLIALRRDIIRIYYLPTRYAATDFTSATPLAELTPPASPLRALGGGDRGQDIDDRYIYVGELSHGGEGTTRLYEDRATARTVVIKSWDLERWNQLPEELRPAFKGVMQKWPAEIQATLLFAGLEPGDGAEAAYPTPGLLPAVDYFVAVSTKRRGVQSRSWRLVVPYIPGGTLEHLARRLRHDAPSAPRDLDLRFRPRLNDLLVVLESLHSKGYCHDDVKLDNILVLDSQTWVLSDLGHVRQMRHPYHDTPGWTIRDQWSNCRTNDVRRLLKTYLSFLRAASANPSRFDDEFFSEHRPWNQLYWDFVKEPRSAAEILEMSTRTKPEPEQISEAGEVQSQLLSNYRMRMLDIAVTRELACIPVKWSWSMWGWIGWLRTR